MESKACFKDLPNYFQRGLMVFMYEGDPVEWSINKKIEDWLHDPDVDILIEDFAKENGDVVYNYGVVQAKKIIAKVAKWVAKEGDFNSFDEWFEDYANTSDVDYGDSVLPIIADDDNEKYIVDGWHRFVSYLKKGHDYIPIIF